jgi:hypothetical protein
MSDQRDWKGVARFRRVPRTEMAHGRRIACAVLVIVVVDLTPFFLTDQEEPLGSKTTFLKAVLSHFTVVIIQ